MKWGRPATLAGPISLLNSIKDFCALHPIDHG
jgi:hypothetical protein